MSYIIMQGGTIVGTERTKFDAINSAKLLLLNNSTLACLSIYSEVARVTKETVVKIDVDLVTVLGDRQ